MDLAEPVVQAALAVGASTPQLAAAGIDLYPVLMALRAWGDKYMAGEAGPPLTYRHRGCGGSAEIVHQCQRCTEEITARDVEVGEARRRRIRA